MSSIGPSILAVLGAITGLFASGLMLILLVASSPNSTPQQWAQIRGWMIAVTAVAILGLAGAVWGLIVKRPWLATGAGLAPAVFSVTAFVVIRRSQR
jgi:hypothetical protein